MQHAVCTVLDGSLGAKGNIHNTQTLVVLVERGGSGGPTANLWRGALQKGDPATDRISVSTL